MSGSAREQGTGDTGDTTWTCGQVEVALSNDGSAAQWSTSRAMPMASAVNNWAACKRTTNDRGGGQGH